MHMCSTLPQKYVNSFMQRSSYTNVLRQLSGKGSWYIYGNKRGKPIISVMTASKEREHSTTSQQPPQKWMSASTAFYCSSTCFRKLHLV